jgi:hypothetical protein
MSTRERSWRLPLALVALSAIPLTAGTLRLIQLAGGPDLMPADHRFAGFPLPLVVHIVGAATYALGGILELVPRFRRRHPARHRRAGRVLAWMVRAYAIGVAAGTQAFTEGVGGAIFGPGVLASDLAKGAGWAINLAVAEWALRRPARRRLALSTRLQQAGALP